MKATRTDMPVLLEAGPASIRGIDHDGVRLALVSVPAGTDFSPLLKGLPDDRCQAPHWGYMLKGRLRVEYAAGAETYSAGDFMVLPAGHTGVAEEDTDFIEVTRTHQHEEFIANARRNLQLASGLP
jgi:hypothetical protein